MALLSVPGHPGWSLSVSLGSRDSDGLRLVARLVAPVGVPSPVSCPHAYRSPEGLWYGRYGTPVGGPAEVFSRWSPVAGLPPDLPAAAASLLSDDGMPGLLLSLEVMGS